MASAHAVRVRRDARPPPRLAFAVIAGLALVALLAPAGERRRPLRPVKGKLTTKIGIADQKPGVFADQRLRDLKLRYSRRSVAWDALRYGDQRADLDAWVTRRWTPAPSR